MTRFASIIACACLSIGSARARAEAGLPSSRPKASKPAPQPAFESLMPKGWHRVTSGLPESVVGVAVGPMIDGARAVVVVSKVGAPPDPKDWDDPHLLDYLARAIHEKEPNFGPPSLKKAGELGAPRIAIDDKSGADPMRVFHLLAGERSEWLITVLAPTSRMDATLASLQRAREKVEITASQKSALKL